MKSDDDDEKQKTEQEEGDISVELAGGIIRSPLDFFTSHDNDQASP